MQKLGRMYLCSYNFNGLSFEVVLIEINGEKQTNKKKQLHKQT